MPGGNQKPPVKQASVVFIAPTQHGKSTTIDKYYEGMTGSLPSQCVRDFVLGNGTTSASFQTTMLPPIKISYLNYVEWPDSEQAGREMASKRQDAYDRFNAFEDKTNLPDDLSEALYSIRHTEMLGQSPSYTAQIRAGLPAMVDPGDGEEQELYLTIIDTPGLDDTEGHGADDTIMEGILDTLCDEKAPDLCAFVFVVKAGMSWSGSFLQSARRYWDQFPTFRENWVFVHTSCDAFAEDFPTGGCFEEYCEQRKKELTSTLANAFEEQAGLVTHLPHVFLENTGVMDSRRKAHYRGKAEFQAMERAKAFNKLTKTFASNQMKKVSSLEYRKSQENENLDASMTQLFWQRKQGVQSALLPMQSLHGRYTDKVVELSQQKQDLEHTVRTAKERLQRIDTSELIAKVKKTAFENWTMQGGKIGRYRLKVPYPREAVAKSVTKNMGYPKGVLQLDHFAFNHATGMTELLVTCTSPFMRGYEFELKLCVMSSALFGKEIAELKELVAVKQNEYEITSKEYDSLKAENKTVAAEIEVFTNQIEFFGECTYLSNKKSVDLAQWRKLSPFYKWAQTAEGMAQIRNPAYANALVERFVEAYEMKERYLEVVQAQESSGKKGDFGLRPGEKRP